MKNIKNIQILSFVLIAIVSLSTIRDLRNNIISIITLILFILYEIVSIYILYIHGKNTSKSVKYYFNEEYFLKIKELKTKSLLDGIYIGFSIFGLNNIIVPFLYKDDINLNFISILVSIAGVFLITFISYTTEKDLIKKKI